MERTKARPKNRSVYSTTRRLCEKIFIKEGKAILRSLQNRYLFDVEHAGGVYYYICFRDETWSFSPSSCATLMVVSLCACVFVFGVSELGFISRY